MIQSPKQQELYSEDKPNCETYKRQIKLKQREQLWRIGPQNRKANTQSHYMIQPSKKLEFTQEDLTKLKTNNQEANQVRKR